MIGMVANYRGIQDASEALSGGYDWSSRDGEIRVNEHLSTATLAGLQV